MHVHLVQFDPAWEDKAANHGKIRSLLDVNRPVPGSLVVLPEMFATGFSLNLAATAQTSRLEDEAFLAELAHDHACYVMGGVVSPADAADGRARNLSVTFAPDGARLACYTKLQPFSFGGESQCHIPGAEVVTFPWAGFTVAPLVCYDLRFPEHFRTAAKKGANLMAVIASWPVKRYHHWLTLLQARAIENLAYVIGVNRTGSDPNLKYNGRSIVVSPHGHIIADAGEGEGVVTARLDLSDVTAWREQFPALKDMR